MTRVLVAEDDFVITSLYQIHFRRHGIEGAFFTTGRSLLDSARLQTPAVVVLDYELPDLHGPEVMEMLHQIPGCEAVPVVFVTGRATPEVEDSLREAGAVGVFGKPFSPLQLISLIQRLTAGGAA